MINNVDGWFDQHTNIRNLTPLSYTAIDHLSTQDLHMLPKLESIALPVTFNQFLLDSNHPDNRPFAFCPELRYIDMISCDSSLAVANEWHGNIKQKLGINDDALVYLPQSYGATDEHNVIWGNYNSLYNNYYDINDSQNYCVPYAFTTRHISNTRRLKQGSVDTESYFTLSLPYSLPVPSGTKAYKLSGRNGNELSFTEVTGQMDAHTPYILKLTTNEALLNSDDEQTIQTTTAAAAQLAQGQIDVLGYSMRGTYTIIDSLRAVELGALMLKNDNKWYSLPEDDVESYIPPFRTYLLQNGGSTDIKGLSMKFIDADTEGIESIINGKNTNDAVYDLSGRRVDNSQLKKGIYIIGGKKVAVR